MSPQKAPSEGTKVDLGRNAPVKQEAAGPVPTESLAAESYKEGGAFASNQGIRTENLQSSDTSRAAKLDPAPNAQYREAAHDTTSYNAASYDEATGRSDAKPKSDAGTAPSYVNNQYIRDPKGPHGKNLQEGGWDDSKTRDGLQAALNAEPGSEDDPARAAEYQFELKNNAKSGGAGPREGSLTNETTYDKLDSNVSA